jgi:hypothetical protein
MKKSISIIIKEGHSITIEECQEGELDDKNYDISIYPKRYSKTINTARSEINPYANKTLPLTTITIKHMGLIRFLILKINQF